MPTTTSIESPKSSKFENAITDFMDKLSELERNAIIAQCIELYSNDIMNTNHISVIFKIKQLIRLGKLNSKIAEISNQIGESKVSTAAAILSVAEYIYDRYGDDIIEG